MLMTLEYLSTHLLNMAQKSFNEMTTVEQDLVRVLSLNPGSPLLESKDSLEDTSESDTNQARARSYTHP